MSKTVVAISTAPARGAIALIRLTGEEAIKIADAIFVPPTQKRLINMPGNTCTYGNIFLGGENIDEGVATIFRTPKSYTGENMVEISCHGNPVLAAQVMQACVEAGAEPAGAGEFTKRAFLNGKLSLTQAEAVAELIAAKGAGAARLALSKRTGELARKIDQITAQLTHAGARLAVWVDNPDEEGMGVTHQELNQIFTESAQLLSALIAGYSKAVMISQGVTAVIAGRPNAGKSTVMNRLCREEKSIVSGYEGTTRDLVEGAIEVGNVTLKLLDTAGLRDTSDPIESMGVDRAKEQIAICDIVILLLDSSCAALTEQEEQTLLQLKDRVVVVVLNKQDIAGNNRTMSAQVSALLPQIEPYDCAFMQDEKAHPQLLISISAQTGAGLDALREAIEVAVGLCENADNRLIANTRQLSCVIRAQKAVEELIEACSSLHTLDALTVLLDAALEPLWEITGKNAAQAVIEEVFSKFCVGK